MALSAVKKTEPESRAPKSEAGKTPLPDQALTDGRRRRRFAWGLLAAVFVPIALAYGYWLRTLESLRFAHPWALLLIPMALGLIAFAGIRRGQARRPVLMFSRAAELGATRPGWVARLAELPLVLRLAVVVLLGLALARPQTTRPSNDLDVEGIDIVISLDLSGSMAETDLLPNRLTAAKLVIRDFVRRRGTDRIGLVVFGRDAYTYVPLTLDHGALLRMLSELQLNIIDGKGTAIGNGLGVALARLRRSDARSKVVILLTDGDNNAGNITPEQASDIARQLGIKIYTVLAGDIAMGAADEAGPSAKRFPVNPKLLEEIATKTGGMPYLASDSRALAQRFQDIVDDLEKSRIRDRGVLYAELFPRFLLPAVALLLLETLLRLTRLRRLP
ncbi:MAG TPA: VWA domain-containing protein [Polyangia bacterium]